MKKYLDCHFCGGRHLVKEGKSWFWSARKTQPPIQWIICKKYKKVIFNLHAEKIS